MLELLGTPAPVYLTWFADFDEEISVLINKLRSLEQLGFRWVNQPFLCDGLVLLVSIQSWKIRLDNFWQRNTGCSHLSR